MVHMGMVMMITEILAMMITEILEHGARTLFAVMLTMKVGKRFMVIHTRFRNTRLIDLVIRYILLVDSSMRIPKEKKGGREKEAVTEESTMTRRVPVFPPPPPPQAPSSFSFAGNVSAKSANVD